MERREGAGLWSSFSYVASDSRQLDVIVAELQPAHRTPVNDTVREGGRGGWASGDESRHVFQHQMLVLKKKKKEQITNKQKMTQVIRPGRDFRTEPLFRPSPL